MAREQSFDGSVFSIIDEPPDDIRSILNSDILGASCSRLVDMENHSRLSAMAAETIVQSGI